MKRRYRFSSFVASLGVVAASLLGGLPSASALPVLQSSPAAREQTLLADLRAKTAGHAEVAYHAATGRVRFIGTDLSHPIAPAQRFAASATAEQAARSYAAEYGALFGLQDPARELRLRSDLASRDGRSFVRFQQVHQGVPVLGGELIIQTDQNQNLLSMNGEVLPSFDLDSAPRIGAAEAEASARAAIAKTHGLDASDLLVSAPELWIHNPALLGGPGPRFNALVWRAEVTAADSAEPIRELVLVDARSGSVALHFNQIAHAKNRLICNSNNVVDPDGNPNTNCDAPGEIVRAEGQAATGVSDVDLAYDFSGITYDFLASRFGRDSLDNRGMPMISLVKYCPDSANCPFANAFWNGRQMTYGTGYATADDVVGHEFAHGVTEFTAGLFYYYQSGAINESMSDVFGELIDLTDGRGNDTAAVRWLMGEDLPIGAIRNMSNPGQFNDPDRMNSPNYYGGTQDSGGVHLNSGVNNKATSLLVDGGSFNSRTIGALGVDKVAQIYYEALAYNMTSATDYQDLYNILQQSCRNLIGGHGITSADCQQVFNAVAATEMNQQPAAAPTQVAPVCSTADQSAINVFFDNLENPAAGNWASSAAAGENMWFYPASQSPFGSFVYATSGAENLWGYAQGGTASQPATPADYSIAMTRNVLVPANGFLRFNHSYGFEADATSNYDGGVVEYSTNSGQSWQDVGSLFVNHGYGGVMETGENPLGGRQGFVDHSNGYGSSRANLASLAGQNVRFRFRIGTDSQVDDYGWFIDDIQIYSCATLANKIYAPLLGR